MSIALFHVCRSVQNRMKNLWSTSLATTGRILAVLIALTALTACIGPIKPVPTQQSQEAPPPSTETVEAQKPAEPAPSGALAVPPLPLPIPAQAEAPIPTEGNIPVLEAKPVQVTAQREAYLVPRATTATKTDTPIMETPFSVQVVPQQVLRDQQVVRLDQAIQNVSGVTRSLSPVGASDGVDGFMIRGFQSTTLYRNGVYRPDNHHTDPANLEQIEVLKGPGSILYGRADPGGIVNLTTKQPQATPYYSLQQQFGSYNFYRTAADATGPLSKDESVLYRFNMAYENSGSFRDFVDRKSLFLAPVVKWNVSPRTQITAEFEYQHVNAKEDGGIPNLGNRPAPIPRSRYLDEPLFGASKDERFFTGINWSHEFNPDWKVIHRLSGEFIHGLGSRGIVPFGAAAADGTVDRYLYDVPPGGQQNRYQTSLNLVGNVATGALKHTLLFGYDYLYQTDKAGVNNCCQSFPINVFNPTYLTAPSVDPAFTNPGFGSTRSWHGLYMQDQIKLPFNLHALAGFRYDTVVTTDSVSKDTTEKDHRLSPRVGLLWQPVQWLSLYGSYTENFGISNGFNPNRQPLPSQSAQQWETGVKTEFFDGRLRTTVSYFQLTKQNIAVPIPGTIFSRAIGEAQTRGIELDVAGEILPGWSVIAAYAYMPFAKIIKDEGDDGAGNSTLGNQGNRLFLAAKDSGSLWSTYAFQEEQWRGVKVGAGLVAVGERQGDTANTFQLPGYVIANTMASYEWRMGMTKMTAMLNVNNVFDRNYSAATLGGFMTMPGMPRFFMGSIRMEF
jgi:iron complex outermembrane recepter protein